MLYMFSDLSLGTRFQYLNVDKTINRIVWVKISHNTIAKWDDKLKTDAWVGQPICSFSDTDDFSEYVEVL